MVKDGSYLETSLSRFEQFFQEYLLPEILTYQLDSLSSTVHDCDSTVSTLTSKVWQLPAHRQWIHWMIHHKTKFIVFAKEIFLMK